MANCGKDILLKREGTEQQNRFIKALDPNSIYLNDFGLREWMKFAYQFANHVNFFDPSDSETSIGNWQDFFKSNTELETFLKSVENEHKITPHLTLFVSFVYLLEFTKKRFNGLSKRHLDFYYQKILQIEKLPATPDKVHVIFELAKNSVNEKIAINTELNGEKDLAGKKRIYKTTEEFIVNQAKVAQIKSVYNTHQFQKIKAANKTNSFNGNGGEFINNAVSWWPFAYYGDNYFPELQDAKIGFSLAAEIMELNEGNRSISISFELNTPLEKFEKQVAENAFSIYCSSEKEWISPVKISIENIIEAKKTFPQKELKNLVKIDTPETYKIVKLHSHTFYKVMGFTLTFYFEKNQAAIVGYNAAKLGENFKTNLPVCRFLLKTGQPKVYGFYRELMEKEIKTLSVKINVSGVKNLLLENDLSKIKSTKPFYPFGTQPVKNSKFYIHYPEVFKKNWENIELNIEWKNTPEDFRKWYFAYRKKHLTQVSATSFLNDIGDYVQVKAKSANMLNQQNILNKFTPNANDLIVTDSDYFKSNIEIQQKKKWKIYKQLKNVPILFENGGVFTSNFSIQHQNNNETDPNGQIRISLNQSFLHELFPRIYALAISSEEKDVLIPNEPYTPFIESITLNYSAKTEADFTAQAFKTNPVQLFHEYPFGQAEQHLYLKNKTPFINDSKLYLLPSFCEGGELYIGLENAKNNQIISLLIQVLEGSENPQADTFTRKQKVEWAVLCENEWKTLDSNFLMVNETNNFLQSGIVKLLIPKEASTNNTVLPENHIWLKAKMHKTYDAVCKTIDIQAQAVLAEFYDNNNELSHLNNGLEATTISKLINRIPKIKSVAQPFPSFNGKPQETDEAYYRRISERLRHKNRAINLWDYEHIILQNFPEIHKVKCLNHSSENSFLAPGNVLIIVIPDIVNKQVFDIYQPRVSQNTLTQVHHLISGLNSIHVKPTVINPDYEEVRVELTVKFHAGFDENYYTKTLKNDLTKLLSPWAFDSASQINFGQSLHKSILINYLENLGYVDYVENVLLQQRASGQTNFSNVNAAVPSSPKAILVSAKNHTVNTTISACNSITEEPEKCQK